jgi:glycosyl transferase, family 25
MGDDSGEPVGKGGVSVYPGSGGADGNGTGRSGGVTRQCAFCLAPLPKFAPSANSTPPQSEAVRIGLHRTIRLRHVCKGCAKLHHTSEQAQPARIEAFVIHLARAEQRRAQALRIAEALPVQTHMLDAVDARKLSKAEIDAVYARSLHKPGYPFELTLGEIACFLSHRKAWKEIADRDLDAGLVIEDDVEIDARVFARAFETGKALIGGGCYLQFQARKIPLRGRTTLLPGSELIFKTEIVTLGATCQLVDKKAAKLLLRLTESFDRPVDSFMQLDWLTGLTISVALPSGVREISAALGGTTIQNRSKTFLERIMREVLRPFYRYNIARFSRNNRRS